MKQIFQTFDETELDEVPCPQVKPGSLLIKSHASLISIGTERMVVEFGNANLIEKARQQPDKVKQTLEKVKTDGLFATIEAVKAKIDKPIALGYSNTGVVIKVGEGVTGFSVGDRVVSNGPHAEVVCVPQNLCAKVPEPVDNETAAFTVVAAIGLQGVRLLQPTLGERFVVMGLGLVGLLTVQILRAHGCKVLGVDFEPEKINIAKSFGIDTVNLALGEDPVSTATHFSGDRGIDGVLITAATKSNEPVSQAAKMCRKRGRIVLVGVTGLELSRQDFYEKELTFQVSCSYGPGRYDSNYEGKGLDYPLGFVRWTEQRNFEAVLEMMADGHIQTQPLISHRFQLDHALEAYQLICKSQTPLGIVLEYPHQEPGDQWLVNNQTIILKSPNSDSIQKTVKRPIMAMIGAGEFASRKLLPALMKCNIRLKTVASVTGLSGLHSGRKFGFEATTTDIDSIFNDNEVDLILITTRHDNHASLVCKALQAGKHVFVEKPLALNRVQLEQIINTYQEVSRKQPNIKLLVGFNRRFSPHIQKMKSLLAITHEPKSMIMTVNAGAIPAKHWTQDITVGGGRIIGECCHFIDLLRCLADSPIQDIKVSVMKQNSAETTPDNLSFNIQFGDGSIGTVHYFANGHKSFPKERLEVYCSGKILQLDNFKTLYGYGWPRFKKLHLWQQDKGHFLELKTLVKAIQTDSPSPIPFTELIEVTEASFKVMDLAIKMQ